MMLEGTPTKKYHSWSSSWLRALSVACATVRAPQARKPPVLHQLLGHDLANGLQEGCPLRNVQSFCQKKCPCVPLLMLCSLQCSFWKLCCCVHCNFIIYYPNKCIYMPIPANGTSIRGVFYGSISRLILCGVKRRGPIARLGLKLDQKSLGLT